MKNNGLNAIRGEDKLFIKTQMDRILPDEFKDGKVYDVCLTSDGSPILINPNTVATIYDSEADNLVYLIMGEVPIELSMEDNPEYCNRLLALMDMARNVAKDNNRADFKAVFLECHSNLQNGKMNVVTINPDD